MGSSGAAAEMGGACSTCGAGGAVVTSVAVTGEGVGVVELLATSVEICAPGGFAAVSLWHPALIKSALDIASVASIPRLMRHGAIGDMLAFRPVHTVRYRCNNRCRGADRMFPNFGSFLRAPTRYAKMLVGVTL